MMSSRKYILAVTALSMCGLARSQKSDVTQVNTFAEAVAFVNQHSSLVVLSGADGASVAVWPAMQGRVLTSSTSPDARSFGWINEQLISSGKVQPHINAVGGEDRLWLGPEGGQYSLFFAKGAPFDLDHWYTPAAFDTEPFDVVNQTKSTIALSRDIHLTNYAGTSFDVRVDREVNLLSAPQIWNDLGIKQVTGVQLVGYESHNKITNRSGEAMSKTTGVLSLWVLGQFRAAPGATIVLPFKKGPASQLGAAVKTDYFGSVPADRIKEDENAVFFKADAHYRAKLGVSARRSEGVIGSYDPEHHVLTIVQFDVDAHAEYVNSSWELQKEPYKGDVANCYNDGPPAAGKPQLGNFYELESSSPAEALAPQKSVSHMQRTMHIVGSERQLGRIAHAVLGVSLQDVLAFNHP